MLLAEQGCRSPRNAALKDVFEEQRRSSQLNVALKHAVGLQRAPHRLAAASKHLLGGGGSAERGIEAHDLRRGVIQSTRQHCGTCLATMDVLLTLQGVAWEHVPTEQGFFNPLSVQAHVQGTGLSNDPKYNFNTRLVNMVCFNRLDIM